MAYNKLKIGERVVVGHQVIRPLCYAFSQGSYMDSFVYVNDTPWGQALGYLFQWLDKVQQPIIRRDIQRLNVADGALIPKWTLSWLHLKPYLLAQKLCRQMDRGAFEARLFG